MSQKLPTVRKISILIILLLTLFGRVKAQNPDDIIDPKHINFELLRTLIEEEVNKIRVENGVSPLVRDEHLTEAAQDQAEFMKRVRKIQHEQPAKSKATPLKRAHLYKSTSAIVGENCHGVYFNTKTKIYGEKQRIYLKTYRQIAYAFAQGWKNSKNHFQNIIDKNFIVEGVGIAYDEKEKLFYAAQVFGSEPYTPFDDVKINYKAFGLKPYDPNACRELDKNFDYLPELLSNNVFVENGKLYFYFQNLEEFKQVFKDKKDGIAIDIVQREQYSCSHGNSYYPSEVHRGELLKPVYKARILKLNELKKTNEVWVPVADVPDYVDTNTTEFNLLIIKDNHVCQTIFFNNIDGENIRSIPIGWAVDTVTPRQKYDSIARQLEFEILFEKAKYNYKLSDIKPILDSISLNRYQIKQIQITAYSSVEGSKEDNEKLQRKRAESILKAIQEYQLKNVPTVIKTKENWAGFFESIKGSPYEKDFAKFSKEVIRKIINSDTLDYNLEPYLEDQRKGIVVIDLASQLPDTTLAKMLLKRYRSAIKMHKVDEVKALQAAIFRLIRKGFISKEQFFDIKIPHTRENIPLNNNRIAFKGVLYPVTDSLLQALLKEINIQLYIAPKNPFLLYNKQLIILRRWENNYNLVSDAKQLYKDIVKLYSSGIDKWRVKQLELNYHLIAADYFYETKKFKEREKSLKSIKQTLTNAQLSMKQTYDIARYFMFQMRIEWAVELMKPWIDKNEFDEDFIFSFLTVAIYTDDVIPKKKYYEYLKIAQQMNPERFCRLFGYPNMSFQLLEDLDIKEIYCTHCNDDRTPKKR